MNQPKLDSLDNSKTTDLARLVTEGRNPATLDIDLQETTDILTLINNEDKKVASAVEAEIPRIALAVDLIADRLAGGGRLIYVGAGTSGRLGVIDASECPPTFGTDPEMVQGIIAGGPGAIFKSAEGEEDSRESGARDLQARGLTARDVVVAIAASGRTPYCLGALEYAREVGAPTVAITCNPGSPMTAAADIAISPVVGPEVIMGSTRMKAGTAQKLALNMISTSVMIKLGKVYSNLMVDVRASNEKLVERSKRIVVMATGADPAGAEESLRRAGYQVKTAILMIAGGLGPQEAARLLEEERGHIRKALARVGRSAGCDR